MRVQVSKYLSYLLRHNPEDLAMDERGFVDFDEVLAKVRRRFPDADKSLLTRIVEESDRKRFEIVGNKIRALYGHSVAVQVDLKEDSTVPVLYHGTTPKAAQRVLKEGLKPMRRRWVHLSPTREIAQEVGERRSSNPVILEINVSEARKSGIKFYRATDKVYVCERVPAKYIKKLGQEHSLILRVILGALVQ